MLYFLESDIATHQGHLLYLSYPCNPPAHLLQKNFFNPYQFVEIKEEEMLTPSRRWRTQEKALSYSHWCQGTYQFSKNGRIIYEAIGASKLRTPIMRIKDLLNVSSNLTSIVTIAATCQLKIPPYPIPSLEGLWSELNWSEVNWDNSFWHEIWKSFAVKV